MRFVMPIAYAIGAFSSSVGNIRAGDKLVFYEPGTTTPKTVYSDKELSTPILAANLVADSAGRFPDIYLSGVYKVRWQNSSGTEIDTWDYVDPGLSSGSSGVLGIANGGTSATTAGAALTALGGAPQSGLDDEISEREALDARVVTLETASAFILPGGRLTITSGTPVLTSSTTGQATVYYTPYLHNRVPIWDGSQLTLASIGTELSQALSDNTKSPSAATTNSAYDLFIWNDSGTVRCTRGPAWSSGTARGTGAGTTELVRVNGYLMNAQNISNGPNAERAIYVGTIMTNGSTQLAMNFAPSAASGGALPRIDVWNMYNRVAFTALNRDSANSWTYDSATWRSLNNNNNNRIMVVRGLDEDHVHAILSVHASSSGSNFREPRCAIGVDSTSAFAAGCLPGMANTDTADRITTISSVYFGAPGLGSRYFQALEAAGSASTTNFYGDNNSPTTHQSGLMLHGVC